MSIIFSVPQSHCCIIERFGKYSKVCKKGLNFKLPFIDIIRFVDGDWGGVANKEGCYIELTEQQTDTPPRSCHTKDNVTVQANASVYWRIIDPVKALYEVDRLPTSVSDIALNALRSNIGTLGLDAVLSERQLLNERIAAQLSKAAQKWGIQFTRVEIQDLSTTDETATVMRQQMDAERKRRALVAMSSGEAEAKITIAEAERKSMILRADGEAKAMVAIAKARAEALLLTADAEKSYLNKLSESASATSASQILLAQKYLDGFNSISKNKANKVFLPNSFNGLFSLSTEDKPQSD